MWLNHKCQPTEKRCSYEVIREGFPCKLYFDLEYPSFCNPNKNGIEMTQLFMRCIIAGLFEKYNLKFEMSDILWLDASTSLKYSCHLILQSRNIAFLNNIHAGHFVSSLLSNICQKIKNQAAAENLWPSAEELKTLVVRLASAKEALFCDEGVYTKNRNFRMYLSTKLGKKAPLLLSVYNLYVPSPGGKYKDKDEPIFYDSLITYFRKENKIEQILTHEDGDILREPPKIMSSITQNKQGVSGCTSSPFPKLDEFILKNIKDDYAVGFIRKWTHQGKKQLMIYDIGNYRFCGNIGRHHKSNNIRIVVNMQSKVYYQICYDPECQNYRSESNVIPDDVFSLDIPEDFFEVDSFSQLQNSCAPNELPGNFHEFTGWDFEFTDWDISQILTLNEQDLACFGLVGSEKAESIDQNAFPVVPPPTACSGHATSAGVSRTSSIRNMHDDSCERSTPLDVSAEEEMLMVEAVAAVEIAFDENMFSEETIF